MGTFFVQDVFKIAGIGAVPVGKVERGTLRVGMRANLKGKTFEIKTIEMHHLQITEAKTGDNVGISLRLIRDIQASPIKEKSFFQKIFGASDEGNDVIKKYVGKRIDFS